MEAYVRGVGFWTPGFPDAEAWCSNRWSQEAVKPEARLLDGALGRRATGLTRLGVETLQQAAQDAKVDPSTISTVWASAHGEHETAVAILRSLFVGDGRISPTKFHNSVYNTAAGYASIATGNRAPSTTLSGGADLVAMALLESLCLLSAGASNVIVVMADEPMLAPFDAREARAPLSVAFCVSRDPKGARARISGLRRDRVSPMPLHPRFGGLYVSAAIPLLEATLLQRSACIPLELQAGQAQPIWRIDVGAAGPAASEGGRS
jgi:hypothetical protein